MMVIYKWSQINFNRSTSVKTKLIWSVLCILSPTPLHWHCNNILMGATNANRMSNSWASQNTPLGSQGIEFWGPNSYVWVFFFESINNSCKLQRILQAAKFLFMCSFTYTNIVFLFRHLPDEINVGYQFVFSGDSFSFFRSRFC